MKIVARTKDNWVVELSANEILAIADMEPPNSFDIGGVYKLSKDVHLAYRLKIDRIEIERKLEYMLLTSKELWSS